jgi:GT2 family glycosyltransferase
MTPLVSIIIPTFDRPRYLQEAIEAVLAQTYPNIEVLIFDNGTLDETLAVAGTRPAVTRGEISAQRAQPGHVG